jgi:hypothetical protein
VAPAFKVSGIVLEETTGDSTGDSPIEDVTLLLIDLTGSPVPAAVTDSSGMFLLDNVPPGSYVVGKTNIVLGFSDVTDSDSGDSDVVLDTVSATDVGGIFFVDECTSIGSRSSSSASPTTLTPASPSPSLSYSSSTSSSIDIPSASPSVLVPSVSARPSTIPAGPLLLAKLLLEAHLPPLLELHLVQWDQELKGEVLHPLQAVLHPQCHP